ncbi:DHH family phosphoesterase [Streptomyces sp. NRRL F-5053]|uniref:DHH family phosphoesterase n=1 Tax=Streptomyces sp. NRRL F-5053 TaxID=1463854 RepID=UPI0004C95A0F|nr:DHH family phosphoesterase [Streptomyces sp. NRRL F-5053]
MAASQAVEGHPLIENNIDLFALMCRRRGWTTEYLREIESTEHDELLGLAEMVEALEDARTAGQKIAIAPDYDMDGIAAGILGYAALSELGFHVELHVPDYRRGHDLTPADIAEIHQKWPETQVLLTCDGGVNSHRGIAAARALGWTTLVTDHHEELEPGSTADVTVDPCRLDETYAHTGICGAHVFYQVISAYTRIYRPEKRWEIHLLRLFAGLGTVSDVMPMVYENRQLVRDSLSIARLLWVAPPRPGGGPHSLPEPHLIDVEASTLMQLLRTDPHHPAFLRAFEGFALMLKAFTQAGKIRTIDDITEGFYGFYFAPAMNSPRRTNRPLEPCFKVFTADTDVMLQSAHEVIRGNELRKQMLAEYLEELTADRQPRAPWVYVSHAPAGMFGLLAQQLMRRAGHPVVVLAPPNGPNGIISGSGRAPGWFDIIDSLGRHEGLSAVGHQQACGVRVECAELLDDLVGVLQADTRAALLDVDTGTQVGDLVLGPDADCDTGLDDLQPLTEFVRRLQSLRPFGHGFAEPVVQIAIEPLGLRVDRIGSQSQHLRLVTREGLSCLWWNAAEDHYEELNRLVARASHTALGTLRFTAKLQLNTFRGETRLQAVITEQLAASA